MSAISLFSSAPPEWPRLQVDIMSKVAEAYQNLKPCTTVHPVVATLGLTEAAGFTVDMSISDIDFSDALAFPIHDAAGNVLNVFLASDTGNGCIEDTIIPGAAINGGFIRMGAMRGDKVYIAIDLPSALAIAQTTQAPVACAIFTDNVDDVAGALRINYPDMDIVICAGTSEGPSRRFAARAAARVGAKLAVAEKGGTFIGCYNAVGAEGILRSLEAAEIQDSSGGQPESIDPLDPPVPTRWPGRVNGNLMAQYAVMLIRRYLIVDVHVAITIVLWALATYFLDAIRVAPLLAFLSPTKRCGKTTALGLLKSIVCRPYAASNVSPAALYRMPRRKPTLLIDEIDTFLRSRELIGIVNSGHTRDAASILRVEKRYTVSFDTFFMKAFFGIGLLPETLADRSIPILLERKEEDEIVEKHLVSENDVFAPVRACFAQLAHLYVEKVRHASRNPIKLGNDRAGDNWETLLAVASILGGNWVEYARHAAKLLSTHDGRQSDAGLEELLRDFKLAFDACGASQLSTERLIDLLSADPEKPWATFSRGRAITANDLARMLKPLGIKSKNLREQRAPGQQDPSPTRKGYHRAYFSKAFRQYIPRELSEPNETGEPA